MNLEAKLKQAFTEYSEWYNLENRLAEYERFAWRVIGEAGYPTEWKALVERLKSTPEPPREVKIAHDMFFSIKSVRNMLKKGRPDHVALEMMRLCNKGFNLNFVIIEPTYTRGRKFEEGPKQPRADALSRAMMKAALSLHEKTGKLPKAKELWRAIPEGGLIDEKDETSLEIYWFPVADSTMPAKVANFKNFEGRYTAIRKKITNPHK